MKIYIYACIALMLLGCTENKSSCNVGVTATLEPDMTSLLRNPLMGWGLYDDASGGVQAADYYWREQNEAAEDYASFFYVRWRWSDMEPQEGKYAWIYNENYKKLIQGALDRGLKLCFRVYDNSKDNLYQGTPDYVREAGAKGYYVKGGEVNHWTPYPDDPIFQKKLSKFIEAFAKEYDNPNIVDFIDGVNFGWWGECHNIELLNKKNSANMDELFGWITDQYSVNFKNVALVSHFGSEFGWEAENSIAIDRCGYILRRDGLGSMWFSSEQMKMASAMYGKVPLIGEGCWWGSSDESHRPWASDTKYEINSWRDAYEITYKHAMDYGFQTLDLREIPETKGWIRDASDLVQDYIVGGGYRLYPTKIVIPSIVLKGSVVPLEHEWRNAGNGYLPNNIKNWNYKYKTAFALIDSNDEIIKIFLDEEAEPSTWFKGGVYSYTKDLDFSTVSDGIYQFAVAIVDSTKDNTPGIKIALKNTQLKGWYIVKEIEIK